MRTSLLRAALETSGASFRSRYGNEVVARFDSLDAEYRAVRKQYSLIEICKKPQVAAQVTIEAAEILKVDAAIIFADLLWHRVRLGRLADKVEQLKLKVTQ